MADAVQEVLTILTKYHATRNVLGDERFANLCKEFISLEKGNNTIKKQIKEFVLQMPPTMTPLFWLPVANLCDAVTYKSYLNVQWIRNQLADAEYWTNSRLNTTSYANLAKIAITYPLDPVGVMSLRILYTALFDGV
ncbi:m129r [Myxoma virus]|nr:m129r [Myxoma virus]